jgi:hypothetical protein
LGCCWRVLGCAGGCWVGSGAAPRACRAAAPLHAPAQPPTTTSSTLSSHTPPPPPPPRPAGDPDQGHGRAREQRAHAGGAGQLPLLGRQGRHHQGGLGWAGVGRAGLGWARLGWAGLGGRISAAHPQPSTPTPTPSAAAQVWDLGQGQCTQTIKGAHATPIMKLLIWESFLLSGGLDGSIKIWLPGEGGASVVRGGCWRWQRRWRVHALRLSPVPRPDCLPVRPPALLRAHRSTRPHARDKPTPSVAATPSTRRCPRRRSATAPSSSTSPLRRTSGTTGGGWAAALLACRPADLRHARPGQARPAWARGSCLARMPGAGWRHR